ncbi:MAG: DNA integrity scanning protein DisA nucleotide-binding domain protein [Clostridia bacterium]|nr:DNA integrity scanning protein DisA nucleotide-binding domain protein [Clostridia bacterium]
MNIGERLSEFFSKMSGNSEMLIALVVAVLVFSVLYFYLIKFYVNHGANILVSLFVAVMIIAAGVISMAQTMNSAMFLIVPAIFIVLTVVLYSVEIKRLILAKKSIKLYDMKHSSRAIDGEKVEKCINEIIKALQNMSKNDVGAIIVLSSGNVPGQIIDSGVRIESDISSELIESVFFPKTPLHDGAMIINSTKIVAAGCFLPLSQNVDGIPKDLGTRHRAGIGVTETIDVMSLIVSEETGIISVAKAGKISRYADYEKLKQTLSQYYWQELDNMSI